MQFIDIKKSSWTWQVFTCHDTANSLLSFIFSRHVSPVSGEALITSTACLSSSAACATPPQFPYRAVTACHCLPLWILQWQFAHIDADWSQDLVFILFSLHFFLSSSPKLNSIDHDQELECAKAGHAGMFLWWMAEELMTDFSAQFLEELSQNLIFSLHLSLWLRHSGKLKGQIQLTSGTVIPAKETYSPPVKPLKD